MMESSFELRTVPRRQLAFLVLAALAASLVVMAPPLPPVPAASGAGAETRAVEGYGELPISFEPNVGQAPNRFDFVARGQGFGMAINATGASLALGTEEDLVRLNLLGANRSAHPRALESLPGKVNYFIGNDTSKWRSDVSTFGRVSYREILPGIDVTYYGTNAGTLEYDFVVAPGADPTDIRVKFSGASDVALRDGDLVIKAAHGALTQQAPVLYQTIRGRRVAVEGSFSLAGDEVGFEVDAYDHHRPLVIDPTLIYSTYLGGLKDDNGYALAVDGHGAAYVTGSTSSTSFPTKPPPFQGSNAGSYDAFVTKLNPAGSALIYSTYLGGLGSDIGYGIALDETGAAYVTGSTSSTNFPVEAPFQGSNGGGAMGGADAFVTKLDAAGSALTYSTYLGGSGGDSATGIAVDGVHAVYVTGSTSSEDFPTQAPFQATFAGATDAFITKLNDKASALIYSTYLGGKLGDAGYGIALDGEHAAYVTGATSSEDFPMEVPFQGSNAGTTDAFITMLRPSGSAPIYSTYLGGSNSDTGYGIAVDGEHAAYVTGSTSSTNFPTTPAPFQVSNAGTTDVFVTKLNATGSAPTYSTYLGGSNSDSGYGIALGGGEAYVTGATSSTNFPTQAPFQASNAGSFDAFVTRLNVTGSAPISSTYLGGSSRDLAQGIAVDGSGAYVAGYTLSTNFPTLAPFQGSNAGQTDAFVTKLAEAAGLSLTKSDSPDPVTAGQILTYTLTIQNAGPDAATGVTITDTLPASVTFVSATAGCTNASGTVTCSVADIASGASAQVEIRVTPTQAGTITNTASVTANELDPQPANNQDSEQTTVQAGVTCGGRLVTIQVTAPNQTTFGTAGDDVINGTAGVDTIYGDTLYGTVHGNDIICGLGGNDKLVGDDIGGNAGIDKLYGGAGNDTLDGMIGDDTLFGEAGNDILHGAGGKDLLNGGAGNDRIIGSGGNDKLFGGADDDRIIGDDINGGTGNDNINGGTGNDNINGVGGNDIIDGAGGGDILVGDAGDDKVYGGSGGDTIAGGNDDDTLVGMDGNDKLFGDSGNNTLYGNDGADKLFGSNGDDTLYGGDGNDILDGSPGDDTLYGNADNDKLYGGPNDDTLYGNDGNDTIDGGADTDNCNGGLGSDTGTLCEPFIQ